MPESRRLRGAGADRRRRRATVRPIAARSCPFSPQSTGHGRRATRRAIPTGTPTGEAVASAPREGGCESSPWPSGSPGVQACCAEYQAVREPAEKEKPWLRRRRRLGQRPRGLPTIDRAWAESKHNQTKNDLE